MTAHRKVRKNFNPKIEYRVNVSGCTNEQKKEVQQAFSDAGFPWRYGGKRYQYLDALQYTNTYSDGTASAYCLYGETTEGINMTAEEFLELVYEPEHQGHPHAELMAQYAEDAKTTDKPWELWQLKVLGSNWRSLTCNPSFATHLEYRRKPKTHTVHGVEVPDISFTPSNGEFYYLVTPSNPNFYITYRFNSGSDYGQHCTKHKLCYPCTEEGKQAAIMHSKAMLGINPHEESVAAGRDTQ